MKYSFVALALAAVVSAQSISDIPTCAQPCLEDAIKKDTTCAVTDLACVCKSFDKIQGDATSCVLEKCGSDVAINQVLPAASKLCANPPSGGASSAPASSAPAQTQPASSSAAAAASSSVPPAQMPSVSTPAPAPTTTKVVAPPASSSPAVSPVPTAAAASLGSMGGLAMLVLGAMAL